jgi:acetoin utilization deacetylase AcuC-like enzyme
MTQKPARWTYRSITAFIAMLLIQVTRGGFASSIPASASRGRWFSSSIIPRKRLVLEEAAPKLDQPFYPIYFNDVYQVKLPPNHRFPMEKYRKVRELAQSGIAAIRDDRVFCDFRVSPLATVEDLTTTHCPEYVQRYMMGDQTRTEQRNVGFPWSPSGVQRSQSSVGGTLAATIAVCEEWNKRIRITGNRRMNALCWGAHLAGGTHHAFYNHGEGFCVFSDIAVSANVVLQKYPNIIRRILILDLDVHQGNGNAVLFQGRPEVFTFSMHCSANYFSEKQNSDLDIELPPNCNDETYIMTLGHWLKQMKLNFAGDFDLVFFQAGVDILEDDRLGQMNISASGIQRRNKLVFDFCRELHLPLIITMGGGYPRQNNWAPIVEAHANVYVQAYRYLSESGR